MGSFESFHRKLMALPNWFKACSVENIILLKSMMYMEKVHDGEDTISCISY